MQREERENKVSEEKRERLSFRNKNGDDMKYDDEERGER